MDKKTQIPKDFQVTDDHRRYCAEHWSFLYLPDVFLQDFKECFENNGRTHINWDTTFKTYIRRASPRGTFYNVGYWERQCEQARRYRCAGVSDRESSCSASVGSAPRNGQVENRVSTFVPASPTGLEALNHIRTLLPQWRRGG